jgi:hypothetical protein
MFQLHVLCCVVLHCHPAMFDQLVSADISAPEFASAAVCMQLFFACRATPLPEEDDNAFHYQQAIASLVQAAEAEAGTVAAAVAAAGGNGVDLTSNALRPAEVRTWFSSDHVPHTTLSPPQEHSWRALKQQQTRGRNCSTLTGRNAMYNNGKGFLCRVQMTWASFNCTKYVRCPIVPVQEPYDAACRQLGFKTFVQGCYAQDVDRKPDKQCWNGLSWEYGPTWAELTCCS